MPSIGPRSSAMNFTIPFWTRFGSFASVRVCPLSEALRTLDVISSKPVPSAL
jgi:hypothetical protein